MKYVFLVEMKNTNFVEYNGYLNIGQSIGDETDLISIVFNIFHIQDLGTQIWRWTTGFENLVAQDAPRFEILCTAL